jgi:hypothetical protein
MKISAADLNTLSARTTTRVFDVFNTQKSSWIEDFEILVPKDVGDTVGSYWIYFIHNDERDR